MTPTGEATEGVLTRLRKMDDLKPWGSIVYGPDSDKWGISWNHASRRAAVDDARGNCGGGKCPIELSFLWHALRRVRDLRTNPGRWSSATPCSAPRMPRLTSAARLANLAALSVRSAPTAPAADTYFQILDYLLMRNAVTSVRLPCAFLLSRHHRPAVRPRAVRQRRRQDRQRREVAVRLALGPSLGRAGAPRRGAASRSRGAAQRPRDAVVAEVVAAAAVSTAPGWSSASAAAAPRRRGRRSPPARSSAKASRGTVSPSGAVSTFGQGDGVTFTGSGRSRCPQRLRNLPPLGRLRRNLDLEQAIAAKKPDSAAERTPRRPDSGHILSGFAAHCHPSL